MMLPNIGAFNQITTNYLITTTFGASDGLGPGGGHLLGPIGNPGLMVL